LVGPFSALFCCAPCLVEIGNMSDFIFYWTGLTGFPGYFFGFPDESQKFQSPSANEKIVANKFKFIA
jgi:hypothetical protein